MSYPVCEKIALAVLVQVSLEVVTSTPQRFETPGADTEVSTVNCFDMPPDISLLSQLTCILAKAFNPWSQFTVSKSAPQEQAIHTARSWAARYD